MKYMQWYALVLPLCNIKVPNHAHVFLMFTSHRFTSMAAVDLPPPLVCSICEFSLTSFVSASSLDRGKRGRRSYSVDTSSRVQGPPIDLVENASASATQ
jgi:hypothetical protein